MNGERWEKKADGKHLLAHSWSTFQFSQTEFISFGLRRKTGGRRDERSSPPMSAAGYKSDG